MPIRRVLFSFKGRIPRQTFWFAYIGAAKFLVLVLASGASDLPVAQEGPNALDVMGRFVFVLSLWCNLAIIAKRYHDLGKSAWRILIIMIPIVGFLFLLLECGFVKGNAGPNKYGNDPFDAGIHSDLNGVNIVADDQNKLKTIDHNIEYVCSECGTAVEPNDIMCPHCGKPL